MCPSVLVVFIPHKRCEFVPCTLLTNFALGQIVMVEVLLRLACGADVVCLTMFRSALHQCDEYEYAGQAESKILSKSSHVNSFAV